MRIKYDPEVDILVVDLGNLRTSVGAQELAPGVWLDQDEDGTPLSIEVLGASKRYPMAELEKHPPNYEEPLELSRAAHLLSVTPQALQKAIQRGRLRGKKIGKTWFTSIAAIHEYENSRVHKGPGSVADVVGDLVRVPGKWLGLGKSSGETVAPRVEKLGEAREPRAGRNPARGTHIRIAASKGGGKVAGAARPIAESGKPTILVKTKGGKVTGQVISEDSPKAPKAAKPNRAKA